MTVHLSQAELSQIAARHQSISDKARALTDAGCSIGQIAKLLNRSYHVGRRSTAHRLFFAFVQAKTAA